VTHLAPRDPVSESYRDLRTSLRFSKAGTPPRSILVTSAGPREGKSTTSSNLAVAFAQSGQKCLLVDADLRRPVVHNLFSIEREPGLAEAVAGLVPLDECIRKIPVENLDILPCGFIPHNPSELLGSSRMKGVLEELYRRYEIIIIDSPPVAVVTDALIMAPEVDGTLMVIGAKLGNRRVVQTAFTKLGRSSASVLGAVLNGFDPLRMYTSYGYYTYRYYYYYSDGRKRGSKPRRADKSLEKQSD
jgi:tyrosine-protein kinase Etk/Wzc